MKNPDFAETQIAEMVRAEPERAEKTPAHEAAEMYAQAARVRQVLGRDIPLILQTFSHEFANQLPTILSRDFDLLSGTHACFQTIIDKHLTAIHEIKTGTREFSKAQQNMVRELVETLSKLPVKNWNISPRQLAENGSANCSVAAAALQMMLESTQGSTGITRIDYVLPPDHAFNIVRFPDGSIFYTDPRNGIFENITNEVVVSYKPGLTIYKLTKPNERMPFRYIPALSKSSDGMVTAYLGNLLEVPRVVSGEFPSAFDDASSTERAAMQQEAQQLARQPKLNPETIEHTRAVKDQLYAPLKAFFDDADIKEEIAHFEPATQPDEASARIGRIIQSNLMLRFELKNRAEELRSFFLADTHAFVTSDETLTQLLSDFRSGRAKTWTLLNRTRAEREQEVDAVLERL